MNGTKNGEIVAAISAMNDLLAKYPNDKRLANMAAEWLCANQGASEHGEADSGAPAEERSRNTIRP